MAVEETSRAPRTGVGAELTDEEIVSRVRRGEVGWFEVLMRRHNTRVYRTVRSILRTETDVEDVMQQAYLAAYGNLAQFEGLVRFSTWMIRIAVNEALGHLRRRHRLEAVQTTASSPEVTQLPSTTVDPERHVQNREVATLIETSLDELPEIYRTVFVLREVEGLSTADAATALSVTEDVVKTRLRRAKLLLQESLFARVDEAREEIFPFHAPRCDRVVSGVMRVLMSPRQ